MSSAVRRWIGLGVVAVPFGFLIGWLSHQEGEARGKEALRREEEIAARVRAELAKGGADDDGRHRAAPSDGAS